MGVTVEVKQTLTCDRCGSEVLYCPPQTPQPDWNPPEKLKDFVAVEHPVSAFKRLYCSAICAVEDIGEGKHMPPQANLIVPAGPHDVAAVAHNAKEAAKLKATHMGE